MKYPTPSELMAARKSGKAITVALPGGRHVLLSEYLRSWKILLTIPSRANVENWEWFPCTAEEILRKISAGIHDRINRHLGWFVNLNKPMDESHIRRKLDRLVRNGRRKRR